MLGRLGILITRMALCLWVGIVATIFYTGVSVLRALPGGKVYVAFDDPALRTSAGDIVEKIFEAYYLTAFCLAVMAVLGTFFAYKQRYWTGVRVWMLFAGLTVMCSCLLNEATWINAKVHALSDKIPDEGLVSDSSLGQEFWKWHGISMLLSLTVLFTGFLTALCSCMPDLSKKTARHLIPEHTGHEP